MKKIIPWIALFIAGVSEIVWAYYMKQSNGLTVLFPTVMFIVVMVISMVFLTFATKYLPISIAYPIWVGIGAVGTVLLGILAFGEEASFGKLFFVGIIAVGILGIKASK